MTSRYAWLTRDQLSTLVPELLLIGHMIDRSGMAWCISNFGREEMVQIAIEEWMGASPLYAKRMQRALRYEGDDVITIFKGMQFDIGSPPQFMDFRFTVHDPWHGEFRLDHCGALLDAEPMGEDYVRGMCHDIEDPTFDATAVATNRKAQVRPIHRPPREPSDRHPHCAWTVSIDESHPPVEDHPVLGAMRRAQAAQTELDPIDPADEGRSDYSQELLSDLDFGAFSKSALVRIADEICLQMHLLNLSFVAAVGARAGADEALVTEICTKQVIGVAGLAAERIQRALQLPADIDGAMGMLQLHPLVNPAAYVHAEFGPETVRVRRSPAHDDGAWVSLLHPREARPLQAAVAAIDPHLDVELTGTDRDWTAQVVRRETARREFGEVSVTKVSKGATFEFQPRRSLPLTVMS
jgi:hypothetical protein